MAIGSFKLPNTASSAVDPLAWVRPADWLAMPTIGTQEFIGLLAITDDESNHIALACSGAYTVDWGDGTSQNVASGVKAEKSYTYSSISNSTISTRGYKQVLVRVTPQSGQNLTAVNLQQQNAILAKSHTVGWLDIAIKGSNITSLVLGGNTVYMYWCENADIYSFGTISVMQQLFFNFFALQKVTLPSNLGNIGNLGSMFQLCRSLKTIPLIDTSNNTEFGNFFNGCVSLQEIPLINTSKGLTFNSMFNSCFVLKSIPLIDTGLGTNFQNMFESCYSLRTIPLLNVANGTSFNYMLNACANIQIVPLLNTIKGTNFTGMFQQMYSLQIVPNINTALGTVFGSVFNLSPSIARGAFQGTRYTISYNNMCLSRAAIVEIFNGLGTSVGAQTITVTNNPGRASLTAPDILIATAKGFTVV